MDNTLKMKVDNIGFLVGVLGKDCAPLQYIRELTQNAIEAIQRAGRADGLITWEMDNTWIEGIPKLSITDNGDGMTEDEMIRNINTLSCNGSGQQAFDGNFGIGAKIAAATRNTYGLVYLSWKEDEGAAIQMVKDKAGQYGLKAFGDHDETSYTADPGDPPDIIAEARSGTKIVLLGNHPNQNTCAPPEDSGTKAVQWVRRYLNTRYYRIPANIRIQCRGWDERKDKQEGERYVTGQGPLLDAIAVHKGSVTLKDAIAHWWALPELDSKLANPVQLGSRGGAKDMESFSAGYLNKGHVALLWKNELYDLKDTANTANPKLHQCGIFYGENRVVIYFEPTTRDVLVNAQRTELIVRGGKPPWDAWANEFRAKLPQELQDFIDSIESKKEPTDSSVVKSRIQEVLSLFQVNKYRLNCAGTAEVCDADELDPTHKRESGPPGPGPDPDPNVKPFKRATRVLKPKGVKATPFDVADIPEVIWKGAEDNIRSPGSMEDKAAQYEPATKHLFINSDFRGFQSWINFFAAQYPNLPNARSIIVAELKQWWEQTLLEAVLAYNDYRSSPHWLPNMDHLTEEALTLAVLPRYHLNTILKRAIRSRLGPPQKAPETSSMVIDPPPPAPTE